MENQTKQPVRMEAVLGVIAALSAALLCAMIVLSWPYFFRSEDPEALPHSAGEEPLISGGTWEDVQPGTLPEETQPQPTIPPESNPFDRLDFQYDENNYLYCLRTDSMAGIDVSAFQGEVDWVAVKESGIDFAIIRLGYRGYGTGKMVEDEYARRNLREARAAGLKIGAYFFSQALNIAEVDEEIGFMLDILGDTELDMPIVLDWEYISDTARTANVDARTQTDCQLHFCRVMTEKGYQPMIYFNWHQADTLLYLSELEEYPFWLALWKDRMTYPFKVEMWQYTDSGTVPGIQGNVDINVYFPGDY